MKHGVLLSLVASASLVLTGCVTINVFPGAPNPVSVGQASMAAPQLATAPPAAGFVMPVPVSTPRPIDTTWSGAPVPPGMSHGQTNPSATRTDQGSALPGNEGATCQSPCIPPARSIQGEL